MSDFFHPFKGKEFENVQSYMLDFQANIRSYGVKKILIILISNGIKRMPKHPYKHKWI